MAITSSRSNPRRGEVWLVNLEPTLGTEIRKTRPAVVISSDSVGRLPIKLVAPITEWNPRFAPNIWHVHLEAAAANGLSKASAVDVLQVRGVDTVRFVRKLGELMSEQMEEIILAMAAVIEFPP